MRKQYEKPGIGVFVMPCGTALMAGLGSQGSAKKYINIETNEEYDCYSEEGNGVQLVRRQDLFDDETDDDLTSSIHR